MPMARLGSAIGSLIFVLAALCDRSSAQTIVSNIITAEQLYIACNSSDERSLLCSGYVAGVFDTSSGMVDALVDHKRASRTVCFPHDVTLGGLVNVVRDALDVEPRRESISAADLILRAFLRQFPC
jgi:hypothetical protein